MKLLIVVSVVVAVAVAKETYSSQHDTFDIEAVLGNMETLKSYLGCFKGQSPCDAAQDHLRVDVTDAISTACRKCSPKQKQLLKRFLGGLKEIVPAEYVSFKQTVDPEDKYFTALEQALA